MSKPKTAIGYRRLAHSLSREMVAENNTMKAAEAAIIAATATRAAAHKRFFELLKAEQAAQKAACQIDAGVAVAN